jgi:hypothetical protein
MVLDASALPIGGAVTGGLFIYWFHQVLLSDPMGGAVEAVRVHRVSGPHRAGAAGPATAAPPVVAAATHGTDTPLEPEATTNFEPRLRHDFSAVGVHSDGEATRAPDAVGARADALGRPAPPVVTSAVRRPARPLEPEVRRDFEHRLGHDFSAVRVHSDCEATRAADAVGARAYTLGRHIVIREGLYNPSATEGRRLLAHELTHVIQQAAFADHQLAGAPVLGADHPSEHQARVGDGASTPLAAAAVQRDSPHAATPAPDWSTIRPGLIRYLQRLRRTSPDSLIRLLLHLKQTGQLARISLVLEHRMNALSYSGTDQGLLEAFDGTIGPEPSDLSVSSSPPSRSLAKDNTLDRPRVLPNPAGTRGSRLGRNLSSKPTP